MLIEPNCDMDWDVYKDWLYEFNNNNDLRNIDFHSLTSNDWNFMLSYQFEYFDGCILESYGDGSGEEQDAFKGDEEHWKFFINSSPQFQDVCSDADGTGEGGIGSGH